MSDVLFKLKIGELDIVCDIVFIWEWDCYVDFIVSYVVVGI